MLTKKQIDFKFKEEKCKIKSSQKVYFSSFNKACCVIVNVCAYVWKNVKSLYKTWKVFKMKKKGIIEFL